MAAEISSLKKRRAPGFLTLLSSAACEWFLIFLLFIYAAISYILISFAHYCELNTPCLLCSRLDHVFGKKKPEWYWSLLCNNHREEISSSVSCSIHSKIANVHGMCDECLSPFAMENKSNSESHRLLVGKMWVDIERSVLQNLVQNKQIQLGSSGRRTCSCCNKTWRAKSNAERLFEFTQVGFGASKANMKPPLPRVPGRSRFSRRDSLKRLRDKFTGPISPHSSPSSSVDTLSHVGYTKLKISSDTESEMLFSEDDDDGNASSRSKNARNSEKDIRFGWKGGLNKTKVDDVALEKKTDQDSESEVKPEVKPKEKPEAKPKDKPEVIPEEKPEVIPEEKPELKPEEKPGVKPVILDQTNLVDLSEHTNIDLSTLDVLIEQGLRELNWAESYHKPSPSLTPESISFSQTSGVGGESSTDISNFSVSLLPHMSALSVLSELLSLSNGPLSNNIESIQKMAVDIERTRDDEDISEIKHKEAASLEDPTSPNLKNLNLTGPSTQSSEKDTTSEVGLSSKETSPRANEKHENSRKEEASSSQTLSNSYTNVRYDSCYDSLDGPEKYTTSDEVGLSSKETSPRANEKHENSRKDEASSSQTLSNSDTNVRNDSSYDSLDGPEKYTTSEVGLSSKETSPRANEKHENSRKEEASSSQTLSNSDTNVRNDTSYDSLDENSVSDVEGESVIDRLKRQVDHDQSCMNSLYKELEEERNAAAIAANEAMAMITRLQEEKAALHMEALQYLRMMEEQAEYDMEALERANEILAEKEKELQDLEYELEYYKNNFEDESGLADTNQKEALTKSLKPNGNSNTMNSSISNFEDEKLYILQCLKKLEEELHQSQSNGLHNDLYENPSQKIEPNCTTSDHDKETGCIHGKSDVLVNGGLINLDIDKEIKEVHTRLEALESDRDFLKHASDLLRNGNDGLNLIEEIANQLQELRKIEFTKR